MRRLYLHHTEAHPAEELKERLGLRAIELLIWRAKGAEVHKSGRSHATRRRATEVAAVAAAGLSDAGWRGRPTGDFDCSNYDLTNSSGSSLGSTGADTAVQAAPHACPLPLI